MGQNALQSGVLLQKGTCGVESLIAPRAKKANAQLKLLWLGAGTDAPSFNAASREGGWRDLDGNNDYTPGEVNLDLNGPDFLSAAGATNNVVSS